MTQARCWKPKVARSARPMSLALAAFVAMAAVGGRADDQTFRTLPLEKTRSPQDLARLLSTLRLERPRADRRLSPSGMADRPSEQDLTPDDLPALPDDAPAWAKELVKGLQKSRTEQSAPSPSSGAPSIGPPDASPSPGVQPETTPPNREDSPSASREPRSAAASGNGRPTGGRSTPRVDQAPTEPRVPLNERSRTVTDPQPRQAPVPESRFTPPRDETSTRPPRSPLDSPSNGENGARRNPLERFSMPRRRPEANSPETASRSSAPPQTPRTRKQFDEAINRIVLNAARRAANDDGVEEALTGATSRDSFLTPLMKRADRLLADSLRNRSQRPDWMRDASRQARNWNLGRRLNLGASLPRAPTRESVSELGSSLRLLAMPALAGVLALLAIPLWRRMQPKLTAYLHATATLASLKRLNVLTPDDLVQALDRFLLAQFGLASSWWHCRAVERALVDLRPDMTREIAALMNVYELSRYGPDSTVIDDAQLEQAGDTLRRLATGVLAADETAPLNSVA